MDIATIAPQAAAFLAPFLPYLLKAGEAAASEAGKKLGVDAWERAKKVWAAIGGKIMGRPAGKEAAEDVAANPKSEDALTVFRVQLTKALQADPKLADELGKLLGETATRGSVIASGERSVAIGSGSGNVVITGDGQPKPRGRMKTS
jgi:hypothetical protein